MTSPTRLFAYGILMRDGQVPATVKGYRLAFSGFATPLPAEDGTIFGTLIPVDEARLRYFDSIEGYRPWDVENSYYRREIVNTSDGPAWMYIMNERDFRGTPPDEYLVERMRMEYARLGHPETALTQLEEASRGAQA